MQAMNGTAMGLVFHCPERGGSSSWFVSRLSIQASTYSDDATYPAVDDARASAIVAVCPTRRRRLGFEAAGLGGVTRRRGDVHVAQCRLARGQRPDASRK